MVHSAPFERTNTNGRGKNRFTLSVWHSVMGRDDYKRAPPRRFLIRFRRVWLSTLETSGCVETCD